MLKKIKDMYTKMSLQKKAVLWYTFATIIQNGILFLATPIYTRILSDSEYGIFSVYQSWQQIVSILSILALDRCITVGFMKYKDDRKGFLSSIQLLMTTLVLSNVVIFIIFKSFFMNFMDLPIYIIIIMAFVSLANNTLANWSWLQRYNYSYIKLAIVTILSTLCIQLVGILSVLIIDNVNKGNLMIISTSLVRVIIYGIIYVSIFINGKKGYNKEYWKFSLKYSIAVIPHAVSQIILNSSDRIMIDKICGKVHAAYYSVTYSCAMVLNIIFTSISSAMQPWYFEQIKNKNYIEISKKTNIIIIFSALLSICVCLIAPEIIEIMAPSSYKEAIKVFPTIVGGAFFNSLYLYFANFESFYEKPRYFSIATTTGAVVNVILNFIFIPIFGFTAAGYTTLFCYILFSLMHYNFMRKICKEKLNDIKVFDTKFLLIISIIVILTLIFITFIYSNIILRYSIIFIIVLITLINIKKIKLLFYKNYKCKFL